MILSHTVSVCYVPEWTVGWLALLPEWTVDRWPVLLSCRYCHNIPELNQYLSLVNCIIALFQKWDSSLTCRVSWVADLFLVTWLVLNHLTCLITWLVVFGHLTSSPRSYTYIYVVQSQLNAAKLVILGNVWCCLEITKLFSLGKTLSVCVTQCTSCCSRGLAK